MLTKRPPTDRDWLALIQQIAEEPKNKGVVPTNPAPTIRYWFDPILDQIGSILENPGNKKEATTANEEELEQILQKMSYKMVNSKPFFDNLDPKETQEERFLARKMFAWFLEKKIASSDLDDKLKNKLLGLLKNNDYKGLSKSINEELKNIDKTIVSNIILDINSLIIGIGHLLNRLKNGLSTLFTDVPPPLSPRNKQPWELPVGSPGYAPKPPPRDPKPTSSLETAEPSTTSPDLMAAIRNGSRPKLKDASARKLATEIPPEKKSSVGVDLPSALKDRIAKASIDIDQEDLTNPDISDEEWEEDSEAVTPKKPALKVLAAVQPPINPTNTGSDAAKQPLPILKSDTAKISAVLKSSQPVQKKQPATPPISVLDRAGRFGPVLKSSQPVKKKEQGRPLPVTPPATVPKGSVRSKLDFFKQLVTTAIIAWRTT